MFKALLLRSTHSHRCSSAGSVLMGRISGCPLSVMLNSICVPPLANGLHLGVITPGTGGWTFGSDDRTTDMNAPANDARNWELLYAGVLHERKEEDSKEMGHACEYTMHIHQSKSSSRSTREVVLNIVTMVAGRYSEFSLPRTISESITSFRVFRLCIYGRPCMNDPEMRPG